MNLRIAISIISALGTVLRVMVEEHGKNVGGVKL